MNMIKFRKLYQEPKEGEQNNAIIAYAKRPDIITRKECEYNPCFTSTQTHYDFVNQYRKWLAIDLWIIQLFFDWKTKYKQ